jgi:hypothetical protein
MIGINLKTNSAIQKDGYFSFFGTGSYPLVPHGWQRAMRLDPSQMPLITPHSCIASMVY